ncbi:MAG TPA: hypothetical protein VMU95_13665 [Trebonia sp.]|nr:hypothetical protein [Trebonia sp.]
MRRPTLIVAVAVAVSVLITACTVSTGPAHRAARPARIVAVGPAAPVAGACARPRFVSTARFATWADSGYVVANDMWNVGKYQVRQALSACSYRNWYVTATMDNDDHANVVKSYPNVYRAFPAIPVDAYHAIVATYAHASPDQGIYEDTFDIWFNGVAQWWATEIMIWTDNHGQIPPGSILARVTLDGQGYVVWKSRGPGGTISFVAVRNSAQGIVNLLSFFGWVIARHWMRAQAQLRQVAYGVELVSTDGLPKTFAIRNFWVAAT